MENLDEQAAAVRRELRVRMLVPDLIAEHGKYPDFFIQPGQSEATVRQRYLNELRVEVSLESRPRVKKLDGATKSPTSRAMLHYAGTTKYNRNSVADLFCFN